MNWGHENREWEPCTCITSPALSQPLHCTAGSVSELTDKAGTRCSTCVLPDTVRVFMMYMYMMRIPGPSLALGLCREYTVHCCW